MNIETREYVDDDYPELQKCVDNLQKHIVDVDPLRRQIAPPGYSQAYTDKLLKAVSEKEGKIYFAVCDNKIAGVITGSISPESPGGTLEVIPTKTGWVRELYVYPEYRKKGIGTVLMSVLENYFKVKDCKVILLNIFAPNKESHDFYVLKGYADRDITMIKELESNWVQEDLDP